MMCGVVSCGFELVLDLSFLTSLLTVSLLSSLIPPRLPLLSGYIFLLFTDFLTHSSSLILSLQLAPKRTVPTSPARGPA